MSKNMFIIIALIVIIATVSWLIFFKPQPFKSTSIELVGTKYSLEIAKTVAQKSAGLSNRTELCNNCGMIFIFDKDGTQPFWMKDTLIPLDMIWINSSGEIVSIQTALPEANTPITKLKIYQNQTPAKYVIELNAGEAQKLNLKVGDKVNINL